MPNVLSPRDLVFRPDNMDETVLSSFLISFSLNKFNLVLPHICLLHVNTTFIFAIFSSYSCFLKIF